MTTALAQLPDINDIVAGHDRALALYADAFARIADADTAIKAAYAEIERVTPGAAFHHSRDARELDEFHKAVQLPDRDLYLSVARKLLTLRGWHYIVDRCGVQQLMDAQAKRELDDQLRYLPERPRHDRELTTDADILMGPPPFTADNIKATITKFSSDADMIWKRGIANAFSDLDRRFKSHDGFKVGSRIILDYFASRDSGRVDTYGKGPERFRDIERAFKVLDGIDPRNARSDFMHTVSTERDRLSPAWQPKQSEHDTPYFKIRIFKNGNAHLWFAREDLVEQVNRQLAAYYGEVIGDGHVQTPDPLETRALTPARSFGFFPTPPDLAARIADLIPWYDGSKRILEPSAGTGNLAFPAAAERTFRDDPPVRHIVDAIEIQPRLATDLRNSKKLSRVTTADFIRMTADPTYDGVVMNPPFDLERDIDHVTHALKFLKPNGWLLSIMSAGVEFRETKKAAAFRKLLADRRGWICDLPPGSFASVGTYVNTVLVGFGLPKQHSLR